MIWLRRVIREELNLYVALVRWIVCRPDVPTGARAWGYSRLIAPMLWLWIFASAVEIPLFDLVIPWNWLRITVVVLSVWGVIWMAGLMASFKVHPHLTDDLGIRIRNGAKSDVRIPWDAVATVTQVDHDVPSRLRTSQPAESEAGMDLHVGAGKRVNIQLRLTRVLPVRTRDHDVRVTAVSFLVDEPRAFQRWLSQASDRSANSPEDSGPRM